MTRNFAGNMTHDQAFAWLNPEGMTIDEKYSRTRLLSDYAEIPAETYDYFLNVLPPRGWRDGYFAISEATSQDVRLGLFQIGDRYFAAHVSDHDAAHKLATVRDEIAAAVRQ